MWIVYRTPLYSMKIVWTKTADQTTALCCRGISYCVRRASSLVSSLAADTKSEPQAR